MNLIAASLAALLAASPAVVSHIDDDRIQESSGLAYSVKYPDLAYTVNDSKNRMVVYAIQVSTGKVVGTTDLESLDLKDPESIAVDPRGRVWLGDLGDNHEDRDNVSIVAFDEPGPTSAPPVGLQRYPVRFPKDPVNVEAMMVYPANSQIFLISKKDDENRGQASLFVLPPVLQNGQPNVATDLHRPMPQRVSDATFAPDGRHALVETHDSVDVLDVTTWQSVGTFDGPGLPQGESMTVEPGGRSVLMGTEGKDSALVRLDLPDYALPAAQPTAAAPTDQSTAAAEAPPADALTGPNVTPAKAAPVGLATMGPILGLVVIGAGIAILRVVQRHRRLARRHRRIDQRDRA
ncbi:MAG: hypothetical protein ACJ71Z_05150 [Aeromicrobium sp.]